VRRLAHRVVWDDQDAINQQIDAGEMMRRLARVLAAEFTERDFRGEARYELRRVYAGALELTIGAGHIYDTREVLSIIAELRHMDTDRLLASCHLSQGLERVKVSRNTAWLRAMNGTVLIVGEGLGGLLEVQT
jgi:hypothetical protein